MQEQLLLDSGFTKNRQYSIQRLEMRNWGGYGETVVMDMKGQNAVVIGKNGVGKTTALHAFNTIFKNPRTNYTDTDKDGKKSSRTDRDYVRNVYGEKTTGKLESRADISFDTVLLLILKQGENNYYSLGLIIEHKHVSGNINRTYFTANKNVSIENDIVPLLNLEAQAKAFAEKEIKRYTSYQDYILDVSDFINTSTKIFELIEQFSTVKSVSNLDILFKEYILEAFMLSESEKENISASNIEVSSSQLLERIEKQQIGISLAMYKKSFQTLISSILSARKEKDELEEDRKLFGYWQINKKIDKAKEAIKSAEENKTIIEEQNASLEKERELLQNDKTSLDRKRDNSLQSIEEEIKNLKIEARTKKGKYFDFTAKLENIGYPNLKVESEALHKQAIENLSRKRNELLTAQDKFNAEKGRFTQKNENLSAQMTKKEEALKEAEKQKNTIGVPFTNYRDALAAHLNMPTESLPFVGEVLKLEDLELAKQYVDLGRTIIIPKEGYKDILYFVDNMKIKEKLNFISSDYKYPFEMYSENMPKHELKEESSVKFVAVELLKSYVASMPYCDSAYNGSSNTLFRSGLFSKDLAEKRAVFEGLSVFGWDNKPYIAQLKQELENIKLIIGKNKGEIQKLQVNIGQARELVSSIDEIKNWLFLDINYFAIEQNLTNKENLYKAKQKDVEAHNKLIDEQIFSINIKIKDKEKIIKDNTEKVGENKKIIQINQQILEKNSTRFEIPLHKEDYFERKQDLSDKIYEDSIKNVTHKLTRNENKLELDKNAFLTKFSQICYDEKLSVNDDSIIAYLESRDDDILETRKLYSEQLYKTFPNIINSYFANLIALEDKVKNEISKINTNLKTVEFNNDTYLQISATRVKDKKLENYLALKKRIEMQIDLIKKTEKEEDRENYIKELSHVLIMPLVSKEKAYLEEREKWSRVSNWFDFSIVEYSASDNSEIRYYKDLSSVSGGQKETMSIALLGSILSFNSSKGLKNSFASVFIDEAFSSVDNSEKIDNMLKMLRRLNIQYIVITPYTHLASIQNNIDSAFEVISISDYASTIYHCEFETIDERKKVVVVGDTDAENATFEADI